MARTQPPRPRRSAFAALTAALLAGGFAAAPASAQTLQELYTAAASFDATILSARALADSAEYRVAQVDALGRPSVTGTAGGSGARGDYPAIGNRSTNTGQGAINARYPLFNRANSVSIDQAHRSLEQAQAALGAAEQDLIVRVSQAYFDVLAAQDTLTTTRTSKAAITEQLASAKRNFEVGTATITDTREAQARYDLANAAEIAAENDLRTRRIALDTIVGRMGVDPRPLKVPVSLPAVLPANAEDWVTSAEGVHPTIVNARVALDVATLEIDKARAGGLPTVDAVASLTGSDQRGSAITYPGTSTVGSVGVQLTWPLYTGGAVSNRVKETQLLEQKARADLEAARRAVAQATRVAYFGVQSGQAQVKALEAAEASSKLSLEATQLGYRVGVRVNLDVLNAQTQLFTTQRDLAKARYDVIVGSLRLRQAAGQLAPADVQTINTLLVP